MSKDDIKLFYRQKEALLRSRNNCTDQKEKDLLSGILHFCDAEVDLLDPDVLIWYEISEEVIKESEELENIKKQGEIVFGYSRLDIISHLETMRDQEDVPEEISDDELINVVSNMDGSFFYEQMEADIKGHISDKERNQTK